MPIAAAAFGNAARTLQASSKVAFVLEAVTKLVTGVLLRLLQRRTMTTGLMPVQRNQR